MSKTPEYIKRNVKKYRDSKYFIQVGFSKDLKERLQAAGITGSILMELGLKELEKREAGKDPLAASDQDLKKDIYNNSDDICPFN